MVKYIHVPASNCLIPAVNSQLSDKPNKDLWSGGLTCHHFFSVVIPDAPYSYHVDVIAWGLKDLNILAIHPLISWQTNNDTTIGGFVHILKKLRIPRLVADSYTGFEIGWALSAPLLRLGGPYFGGNMLLTNGNSLAIMFLGSVVGILQKSPLILGLTAIYVIAVTVLVRILSSSWNR